MANSLFENQIPFMKPWVGEEEWLGMKDVILSGWVSQGPKVEEFERLVAQYLGAKFAVAMNSCTSAMHIAMKIAGVKFGDEVILANSTCMANVNAIIMAGGIPVFVDIDKNTYNINIDLIEEKINTKTKIIMNIDQIGLANDLDKLKSLSDKYGLYLLDDAATAFGGKYKDNYLGSSGVTTTFSFHPRKMITTGEGGMLVTNDEFIAEKAKILRATGASISDLDRHKAKGVLLQKYYESGYNYRMTDLQAAMGIIQMTRIDEIVKQRREQAEFYNKHFIEVEELQIPFVPDYATPAWSSYCLKLTHKSKKSVLDIVKEISKKNISFRFGIQPLHKEPYFKNSAYSDSSFPVSCEIANSTFFIPIYPGLTESNQTYIIDNIKKILKS